MNKSIHDYIFTSFASSLKRSSIFVGLRRPQLLNLFIFTLFIYLYINLFINLFIYLFTLLIYFLFIYPSLSYLWLCKGCEMATGAFPDLTSQLHTWPVTRPLINTDGSRGLYSIVTDGTEALNAMYAVFGFSAEKKPGKEAKK